MIRFIALRLLRLVAVLLFASVLVFSAVYFAPGSPLSALAGGRALTQEQAAQLQQEYHLNDPLWTRYWSWLSGVLHGDFGTSLISKESVSSLISERIDTTALLVAIRVTADHRRRDLPRRAGSAARWRGRLGRDQLHRRDRRDPSIRRGCGAGDALRRQPHLVPGLR